MSNITEWIKYELYPNLFEVIDTALPEHNFIKDSRGWRSKTYLNGTPHNSRTDKTVVTKKAPGLILEQGGEVLSIVDYVIRRDSTDFINAVKTLSRVANIELPKTEYNEQEFKSYKQKANLLEDCNNYFTFLIKKQNEPLISVFTENLSGEPENDYIDENIYLQNNRGYSIEEIEQMELGFIPSQERLNKYLLKKGYSKELIAEVLPIHKDNRIGKSHRLTIPYRSGGIIKGFKFRTVLDHTPKYLNSYGLNRKGGFFNISGIKGDKDLVIVEGELDSLHATVKGVDNVVSTGGSNISPEQIKDALKRGAKKFSLCYDNEPGKEEQTIKNIESSIDVILNEGVNRVYIVNLPQLEGDKTDPDRLIKEEGVETFKKAIAEALPYYDYLLQNILNKYGKIQEEGEFTHKDRDNLLEEVLLVSQKIKDPTDKDLFVKTFTSLEPIKDLGITEESLSITLQRLNSTEEERQQKRELNKLLSHAKILQDKGEVNKALDLLDTNIKGLKGRDKKGEFSKLLLTPKEEDIRERLSNKPESLKSGFNIGGESLLIPSGAISIFTAPTSHGKTSFLINLALNLSKEYSNKETYFFSFEEDSDSILIKSLNTYINQKISGNNRTTLENYFRGANNKILPKEKEEFFNDIIDSKRLNINYCSYDSDTLIEAIRYLKNNANPGAILIDYIQLLNLSTGKYKTYSRQEELKQLCIDLKDIAVETGLPIILGAQFNRTVVNPLQLHATKIGEAGDIERIANLIVGFWNNNFKSTGTEGELKEISNKGCTENTMYVEILKQRGGKVGLKEILEFNGNTGKISNNSNTSKQIF